MRDTEYKTEGSAFGGRIRDAVKVYLQPAFLVCVIVLAVAGSGMSIAIKSFGVYLEKEPLPLKKSLDLLDESDLAPYKVVSKVRIENKEVVKSLGTEDYIQWVLEDADVVEFSEASAVRNCLLFITYYELPDVVPHIPEECYTGSGYQRLASDSVAFSLPVERDAKYETQEIPGRYLIFGSTDNNWQSGTKFSVLYIFNVNRVYVNSREDARMILNKNIFGKHSYFCKIEWSFFGTTGVAKIYPAKEEAIAASQKLLGVILPVLEREHWPELEK